jgi:hypothetical protein
LEGFDTFLSTLEKQMDLITTYFISRSSSGWVEGWLVDSFFNEGQQFPF